MYNMTIEISIKFEIKNMSAHLDHTLSVGRQNASNFFNVRFKLSEKIQKSVVTGGRQKQNWEKWRDTTK